MVDILEALDGKWEDGTRPKDLFENHIKKDPAKFLDAVIEGLGADRRKVQSGCSELASLLSEHRPELLYPHVDLFLKNMKSPKAPVLRWEAVCTVGNLASVDAEKKIPHAVPVMVPFLRDKSIVLAGHTVSALSKIAKAYPRKAPKILDELLAAEEKFEKNKVGFIIEAMEPFLAIGSLRNRVLSFVRPHSDSEIKVVAKKAKRVLRAAG